MPALKRFSFYRRLTSAQKREYDRSDAIPNVPVDASPELGRLANDFVLAVGEESTRDVARAGQLLLNALCEALSSKTGRPLDPPRLKVLRERPVRARAELHGLYNEFTDGHAEIRVWMLTAANRRVVRPRTLLRTLLHELCHHLDIRLFGLPSSFHTLAFHTRESSLLRALERSGAVIPSARPAPASPPPDLFR